jgi:hypothetical protein
MLPGGTPGEQQQPRQRGGNADAGAATPSANASRTVVQLAHHGHSSSHVDLFDTPTPVTGSSTGSRYPPTPAVTSDLTLTPNTSRTHAQ